MALGKYKLALRDYERVSKVRPNDKDAKAKFTECRKIVQQIAFNKAIAVDEKATFAIFFSKMSKISFIVINFVWYRTCLYRRIRYFSTYTFNYLDCMTTGLADKILYL